MLNKVIFTWLCANSMSVPDAMSRKSKLSCIIYCVCVFLRITSVISKALTPVSRVITEKQDSLGWKGFSEAT